MPWVPRPEPQKQMEGIYGGSQTWQHTPVMPALGRLRQGDKFKASLAYMGGGTLSERKEGRAGRREEESEKRREGADREVRDLNRGFRNQHDMSSSLSDWIHSACACVRVCACVPVCFETGYQVAKAGLQPGT